MLISLSLGLLAAILCLEYFYYLEMRDTVKFKNAILNLDVNKSYSLQDIEKIYMYIFRVRTINEYNLNNMDKFIKQVIGNLLLKETNYELYYLSQNILKILKIKQKTYTNDKEKLLDILKSVLLEIDKEKQFFGLDSREKKIFQDLITSNYLKENDIGKLEELKIIITDRYQKLLDEYEKSNKNAKSAKKYARIGIVVTLISLAPFFNTVFVWLGVIK